MKIRLLAMVGFLLLLGGCSHTSQSSIGKYQNNIYSGTKFLSQYEMVLKVEGKQHFIAMPFPASDNRYLPEGIEKLHLGLKIYNPIKDKIKIWIEARFTDLDTGNLFKLTTYVYGTHGLPEEFISIPLPRNVITHSQIEFWVKAISEEGNTLYQSSKAYYKVRKSKKKS